MEEIDDLPPARKVVTRAPSRTVRVLNLAGILDAPIECESSLERDFVYRAVLCPSITQIRHQPFQLTLSSGRKYTPDFLVRHRRGPPTVVEVKPASKSSGYRAAFDEASHRLAERGVRFVLANDRAIRHNGAHERAALILRYRKALPEAVVVARVLSAASGPDGIAIGRLLDATSAPREAVLHLLAKRALVTSSSLSLTAKAKVHQLGDNDHEVRIEDWFGLAPWRTHARSGSDPA
jgi:hypothetical protein